MTKTRLAWALISLGCLTPLQATELTADPDIIMNNGLGTQIWGDNVFISAFNLDGSPGELIYDTEFRDRGFGVAGGRWDQIDYYQDYNGQRLNASERLLVQFNGAVTDVMLTVGMLGLNEGRRGDDETGQWIAYDADDQEIGRGVFGPDDSDLGPEVKFNRTYGQYPFTVSVNQPIYSLAIEATGFAYGQGEARSGVYKDRGLNSENNSDFNLVSIEYQRTDGVTPMTPEPVTPEPEPATPQPATPQPVTTDESVVLNGQWYFQPIGLPGTTLGVESRDNRTSARALSCDQGAQRWVVNHLGDGLHNITLAGKGRQALEAWQPVPDNLDDVTIYRRNNFSWQRWAFAPLGSDRFIVTGVYNPRALTVDGSANVIVSDADQSAAQQWLVTATDPCSR